MKHVFYFLAIFPLLFELACVCSPAKFHRFSKRLKAKPKDKDVSPREAVFVIASLFYLVWAFTGMMSFQWPAFVFLFALSLIPKPTVWMRWLDAALSLAVLFFVLLNAYHFKIDLWQWLTS